MAVLEALEPREVFGFFEDICNIPHGSGDTDKISNYLVDFAKNRNLRYIQDESGNVIIFKPGTKGYENSAPVIIQGHMDMVCEKDEDCDIDFKSEGLRLAVADGCVYAKGTTLGGDDGIAVAYALALLDSKDDAIPHPPLEVVITVDEEIGLLGANAIDCSPLKGKMLLNIDSEDEGILLVSCAGGATAECVLPVNYEKIGDSKAYKIVVSGVTGGHSGVEIHKQGANSNMVMGRVLDGLIHVANIKLYSFDGGLKDNAIPRQTVAIICVGGSTDMNLIKDYIEELDNTVRAEYSTTDEDIHISIEESDMVDKCMTEDSANRVICALRCLPNGVLRMHPHIDGLVQTSLNLGILKTKDAFVKMHFSVRSSMESEKKELTDRIETLMTMLGGNVIIKGVYPAWEYKENSKLRDIMVSVYEKLFGNKPQIEAIHAGLECGIFAGKIDGLDCVSYGPQMDDIHTPSEKLYIESTARYWEYTKEILKALK